MIRCSCKAKAWFLIYLVVSTEAMRPSSSSEDDLLARERSRVYSEARFASESDVDLFGMTLYCRERFLVCPTDSARKAGLDLVATDKERLKEKSKDDSRAELTRQEDSSGNSSLLQVKSTPGQEEPEGDGETETPEPVDMDIRLKKRLNKERGWFWGSGATKAVNAYDISPKSMWKVKRGRGLYANMKRACFLGFGLIIGALLALTLPISGPAFIGVGGLVVAPTLATGALTTALAAGSGVVGSVALGSVAGATLTVGGLAYVGAFVGGGALAGAMCTLLWEKMNLFRASWMKKPQCPSVEFYTYKHKGWLRKKPYERISLQAFNALAWDAVLAGGIVIKDYSKTFLETGDPMNSWLGHRYMGTTEGRNLANRTMLEQHKERGKAGSFTVEAEAGAIQRGKSPVSIGTAEKTNGHKKFMEGGSRLMENPFGDEEMALGALSCNVMQFDDSKWENMILKTMQHMNGMMDKKVEEGVSETFKLYWKPLIKAAEKHPIEYVEVSCARILCMLFGQVSPERYYLWDKGKNNADRWKDDEGEQRELDRQESSNLNRFKESAILNLNRFKNAAKVLQKSSPSNRSRRSVQPPISQFHPGHLYAPFLPQQRVQSFRDDPQQDAHRWQ